MNAIHIYIHGFKIAFRNIRMGLWIYLFYLLIALLLALPFYGLLRSSAGNSELPKGLMQGFDATIIREILANHGESFRVYLEALFPWLIAFALLQVWITGGIFSRISEVRGRFSLACFSQAGVRLYWRFFKLMIFFLLIQILLGIIIYLPYLLITGASSGLTDKQTLLPLVWLIGVHFLLASFVMLWSDLSKSRINEQDSKQVFKEMMRMFKTAIRKFFPLCFLGVLLALVPIAVVATYYLIRSSVAVDSLSLILVFLVIQQGFILLRIGLRIWRLSSMYRFYLSTINPIFGP